MNASIGLLTRLFAILIQVYPHKFQDEFAEEMQKVFRDSLIEAILTGRCR